VASSTKHIASERALAGLDSREDDELQEIELTYSILDDINQTRPAFGTPAVCIIQVTEWLAENRPPGAAYVVIDDELTSALPAERVVSPSNQTGLTDKDVEQAIAILSGTF